MVNALLLILRKSVTVLIGVLIKLLLSERVVIGLMIRMGDWIVKRTTNTLDDEAWVPIREELQKILEPQKK